jgi:hypothetical protein
VRRASINYYTSPDRVGPPSAEIEQNISATNFSNSELNPSHTAAIEPVGGEKWFTECDNTSGNPSIHFITRFINSTYPPVDQLPQTAA